MDPIPITKIKISKDKWLNTLIKYEKDYYIKDVLEIMCQRTYNWIYSKKDLELITDYDSFKDEFINLMYIKYLN